MSLSSSNCGAAAYECVQFRTSRALCCQRRVADLFDNDRRSSKAVRVWGLSVAPGMTNYSLRGCEGVCQLNVSRRCCRMLQSRLRAYATRMGWVEEVAGGTGVASLLLPSAHDAATPRYCLPKAPTSLTRAVSNVSLPNSSVHSPRPSATSHLRKTQHVVGLSCEDGMVAYLHHTSHGSELTLTIQGVPFEALLPYAVILGQVPPPHDCACWL